MAEKAQGITAITVGGYKSIRDETTIEIRPLTILAGANSSGKSSIMQPMLMMKQTLDATYDPGPLLLNGPNVRFSHFEQLKPKSMKSRDHVLKVRYQHGQELELTCEYTFPFIGKTKNRTVKHGKISAKSPMAEFSIQTEMSNDEIIEQIPELYLHALTETAKKQEEATVFEWRIEPYRCFLSMSLVDTDGNVVIPVPAFDPWPTFANSVADFMHVSGLRDNPERTYPLASGLGPRFPGPFHNYVASLLLQWNEGNQDSIEQVEKDLIHLRLTRWVRANRIGDTSVEILVGRLPVDSRFNTKNDVVNIADVGLGISQVLPVLVALVAAVSGQVVYIEQPELHLHPRAQVALASVLANAALRGVRVVVETHSSLLLQGVMTLIAEKYLSPDLVKLHWFRRDEEGYTEVRSEDPNANGAYGDWPVDFADIRLTEQRRYLDAVAKRKLGLVNDPA